MSEVKNDFRGGLDLDSSYYTVSKNAYGDALNITRDAILGNQDNAITNIVGNRVATYSLPTGTNKCIGAYPLQLRNTVIYFVWNSSDYHSILEFNNTTRITTKIFENLTDSAAIDILGFTENEKITQVDVYPRDEGDLLFFIDSLDRPTEMDIALFKAGVYTPVTRALIDTGKMPPLAPPSVVYDNDTTFRVNYLRKKFFRFKTRFIYDDFTKSSFSPISVMPIPTSILSDVFTNIVTNNNVIRMTTNSGGKNVKSIEIGMSFVDGTNNWSDFQSVTLISKAIMGIADNVDFAYAFYNDSTYPNISLDESNELFYWIPDKAKVQGMPNGNVLAFAAITEGYNKTTTEDATITVNTVAAGGGGSVGNLDSVLIFNDLVFFNQVMIYGFSGIPAVGTIVTLEVNSRTAGMIITASTYTTVASDTNTTVAAHLAANVTAPNIAGTAISISASFNIKISGSGSYDPIPATGLYSRVTITPPTTAANTNSIATWKWSTQRNIARGYFDQKGKTNGILYTDKIIFPAYAENGSQQPLIPFINYKINDVPPDWAYSLQFYLNIDKIQYLYLFTNSVNKTEAQNIYFEITDLRVNAEKNPTTAAVVSYTFQDGDRMRLIRNTADNTVFADTYDTSILGLVVDPKINGVVQTGKQFIKIKSIAPFDTGIGTAQNFIIEIYRPSQQEANAENQVYYEFGRQYPILDPTLAGRRHSGQITDQTVGSIPAEFNFYEGDAYFRNRTMSITDSGYATFNVMDRNVVDFYISAVSSISGRTSIIDINARRQYYSTLIRHGRAYQADTNINALNQFFANNFDEYDYNFGDVTAITIRDRYMKVFQKYKIGTVPLFGQITKDATGNTSLIVTDKLLNPIQYHVGNFGLTSPESLASWHFADYGCDTNKGVVWRDSNDGVQPISELYKVNSWATIELPLRTGIYKIYGAIDPRLNQYIIALETTPTSDAQTLVFTEKSNTFESFTSYYPEMMTTLGTVLISFKNGLLWTHDSSTYNSFYGINYQSYIKFVFNELLFQRKTFEALEETTSVAWECPEIETSLMSYGTTPQQSNLGASDFTQLEGKWCASFLRDSNSQGGIINGDYLKGDFIIIRLQVSSASSLISLSGILLRYVNSPMN